ncbi:WG repeat-containing protein [Kitasatospora sp. NPDC004240]
MSPTEPVAPPYAIPCPWPTDSDSGVRYALVDGAGRLVREPDLGAVGAFHPRDLGGFTAPAADAQGRWGYLDERGRWRREPDLPAVREFGTYGLSPYQDADGRWGYAGTDGMPVFHAAFVEVSPFQHGLAVVRTEEGLGYLSPRNRLVIRGPFAWAGPFSDAGLAPVRVDDGDPCGFIDRSGRMVIEPRFDEAHPFGSGGSAPVRVGDRWGLIDTAGEWVVEPVHPLLNAFNRTGVAYVLGGTAGDRFRGYVDSYGAVTVRARHRLSQTFGSALVRFDDGRTHGYQDSTGRVVIDQDYDWADDFDDFDEAGAAVAHRLDRDDDTAGLGDRPPGRAWGVLRADGRFLPVRHLEPVTDAGGRVVGFGDGIAPFVTRDGGVAYVDREGRDVCRVEPSADGSVLRLVDAVGTELWRTTAAERTFARVEPAHCKEAASYLAHPGAPGRDLADLADLADELLAAEPRRFEFVGSVRDDPEWAGASYGAVSDVAHTFLLAEHRHEFPFLHGWTVEQFEAIEMEALAALTARFGPWLPGVQVSLRTGDEEHSTVWQVGERRLVLHSSHLADDGDVDRRLRLAAVRAEPTENAGATTAADPDTP